MLPSSGNLEENLQQKLSTEDDKEEAEEERSNQEPQTPQERSTSPLRSGVHENMTLEEAGPSQLEIDEPPQQLRRSSRMKKPNPKYIEADLAQVSEASKSTLNQEIGQSRERIEDKILRKSVLTGRNVSNTGHCLLVSTNFQELHNVKNSRRRMRLEL